MKTFMALVMVSGLLVGLTAQASIGGDRTPVPSAERIAESKKLLQQAYKEDFARAGKTPAGKVALLLRLGGEDKDMPARYTVLRQALALMIEAGDLATASAINGMIENDFAMLPAIVSVATETAIHSVTLASRRDYCMQTDLLITGCMHKGQFEQAKELADLGLAMAKKMNDAGIAKHFTQRAVQVKERQLDYAGEPLNTGTVWLTALKPLTAEVGCWEYAVNRNIESRRDLPLAEGKIVSRYIFSHAPSVARYSIPSGMTTFKAVGYCWANLTTEITFKVRIDGVEVFRSKTLDKYPTRQVPISVKIPTGAKEIELQTDAGRDKSGKWATWGMPVFTR